MVTGITNIKKRKRAPVPAAPVDAFIEFFIIPSASPAKIKKSPIKNAFACPSPIVTMYL